MSDEYRLRITVRNNLLLSAIEAAGYKSQADFARAANLSPAQVNAVVAMRFPPINQMGKFTPVAKSIMETLGASPGDLWVDELKRAEIANKLLDTLPPRAAHVIRRRMDGDTLETIADSMHITRERARRIEGQAMRALKNPNHKGRTFLLSQVGA